MDNELIPIPHAFLYDSATDIYSVRVLAAVIDRVAQMRGGSFWSKVECPISDAEIAEAIGIPAEKVAQIIGGLTYQGWLVTLSHKGVRSLRLGFDPLAKSGVTR